MADIIKNFDRIATTPLRRDALAIAEAAYRAIDTAAAVASVLKLEGDTLVAGDQAYDLRNYKEIRILGFGKASCKAIQAVESVLRGRIRSGIAIDVAPGTCEVVTIAQGSHPLPSKQNVEHSSLLVHMAGESSADDLVIVVVSGGGSSLLCWPMDECDQGTRLYEDSMRVGATIDEMNTVRRHISQVKGGGLAAMLYPATVIGLVFCDVPGGNFKDVASGPTYFDATTKDDAERILNKYGLSEYVLRETPKDAHLFEKVHNVPVISNTTAIESMRAKAESLGYRVAIVGDALYDEPHMLVRRMKDALSDAHAVIAGGEARVQVRNPHAVGGRCQYVSLTSLTHMEHGQLFTSIATDGIDNSEAAGALADMGTIERAQRAGLRVDDCLTTFETFSFFQAADDLFFTGPTESNVSDIYMYLREV